MFSVIEKPVQINSALEGLIKEREGEAKPAKARNLATETFSWLKEKSNLSGSQGRIAPDGVYNSCNYLWIIMYSSSAYLQKLCCPFQAKKVTPRKYVVRGSWSGFLSHLHPVIIPN